MGKQAWKYEMRIDTPWFTIRGRERELKIIFMFNLI